MSERGGPEHPQLPPAYRLVALDTVDSTNSEAWRRAEQGAEDGTLVWAREQTEARGRRGRRWVSGSGNLFFSLVLRPECSPHEAAQLGFAAALALGDAIGSVAPPMIEVRYKWPNDVLLNDRKGAGILMESKMRGDGVEWVILGIGVNLCSHPEDLDPPATSLYFEGCPSSVAPVDLLESFTRHFMTWVNRWLDDGFAPIRQAWLSHARGLGEAIRVNLPKETLDGRFKDLDADGTLVLEQPDGRIRKIAAGDVYFVDQSE
jgi:BirA family biotin operon repressor/biotin-[acetyl-CoA-carboxylase] ligase